MFEDYTSFELAPAILNWIGLILATSVLSLIVGMAISIITLGSAGPKRTIYVIGRALQDLSSISLRRVGAIAILTFKEAQRRKAFMIGFLFLLLFMFGGWFLGETDLEKPAKPYISFVLWSMNWLLLLMAILVSCWGIPADIKIRSLHTVVTKPVRRSEIVLGRMLGYSSVITVVLLVTSVMGYIWIQRQIPERARDQLTARVPIFGTQKFLGADGNESKGKNVGDIWDYRKFVEGLTDEKIVYNFTNLDMGALKKQGKIRFEQNFESFRTYKGDVRQEVLYEIQLVHPENGTRYFAGTYPVREFSVGTEDAVVEIQAEVNSNELVTRSADGEESKVSEDPSAKLVSLFDEVFQDGSVIVEIGCIDQQQYIGASEKDLFIRMPDHSFTSTYVRSIITSWWMLLLVVMIGTTASCFLKGPVATMLTTTLIVLGHWLRGYMDDVIGQLQKDGKPLGGGALESMYRIFTQMDQQSDLPQNIGTDTIVFIDQKMLGILHVVNAAVPDFGSFSTSKYVANGFQVPMEASVLPSLATLLGYFIPLVIIGYFALQLRELESK